MKRKKLLQNNLAAPAAFLFVNLIWGAANPIIKYTLEYIPPFTFLFLRLLIVCIILLPYVSALLLKNNINKKDYPNFILLGLLSQSSIAIIFLALKYTASMDATIISIIGGAMIIYLGHKLYGEKMNNFIKYGVFITIAGTLLTVFEPLVGNNHNSIPTHYRVAGNALAVIYNLTWVVYVIWSKMNSNPEKFKGGVKVILTKFKIKPMTKNYPPSLIAVLSMYVGLFTTIPLAVLENLGIFEANTFLMNQIDIHGILGLLYMSLFSSIVAFILYQWALDKGRVSESAIFGYLGPVFSFPIAHLLLGEVPTTSLIISAVIVVIGVIIAETGQQIVSRKHT
ncbi:MAG TPA: DMT family transporter [bacterium]|jgi:drug/metabolite transporter (DMT)-like permease|nr:DMT family transporter [bacterium]HOA18295.1 DMT family transporter [bacterium]